MEKIDRLIELVERALLVGIFLALVVLMTTNIISRNIFHQSSQQILEYLPALVLWLSMLGASIGMRQQKHIRLELLLRFLPPQQQLLFQRLGGIFGMFVMLIALYLTVDFMRGEIKLFGIKGYTAIILPIFFAIAAFRYLRQALRDTTHG